MKGICEKTIYLTALITLTAISIAMAAPPDAGQLMREQQLQRQLPKELPKPEAEKEATPLADSGARVAVKGFKFTGYESLAKESELQELVAESVGKTLTFKELQGLAAKITTYIKGKGWFLARAFLPKQDVTSGIIEIAIIQGKSDGTLIIKRSESARIRERTLRNIGEGAVRSGEPLSEQKLERSMLLMNDLPGVAARASLAPGTEPGSTAIQVDVKEGPLFSGSLWGDNYGNRYTGEWRGSGMVSLNDPLHYGDQLSALVTGSEALTQGRVAYAFPLTSGGLKANLSYSAMHYKLIDMEPLDMDGWGQTANAGLSYPILRSRTANLTASLGYEYKYLTDSSSDVEINSKQLHSGTLGFSGDEYDTFLGGGYTSVNVSATTGNMHDSKANIAITKVEGSYTRFNFGLARLQRLLDRVSINMSYSGQLSLNNLDSSEKFILGGPGGVRAYPVGEASGDEGNLFNVDLRFDLPLPAALGSLQLSGFYDAGQIKLHNEQWQNSINTATNRNDYWLQGAGIGINYAYSNIIAIKCSWAHVIDNNPGRSTTDMNSDGRDDNSRFWLQAIIYW